MENELQKIEKANLVLHNGNCVFAQTWLQYIGFALIE